MSLRTLLGFCEHKWEIISRVNVFETWDGERREGQLPAYTKLLLQCEKCGDTKKKRL